MSLVASPTRYRLRHGSREIDVATGAFTIGRAPDCDLQLSGGLVSRKHALLTCTPDDLVVCDLGSRNGVLVNHRKITGPTHLAHADVLGIGIETLEVIDEHVLRHPAHLSTLPPPNAVSSSIAQPGEADVDAPAQPTLTARLDILTEREREVLELIVLGHTQREIAQRLFVSIKTIETHRARIVEKLGCHTRAELVTYAITAGLLACALKPRPPGNA